MSWLFSRALVAASSAGICLDGAPSAPSSTMLTPEAYLWRDKTTDAWRRFPSGMTCEHLTDDHGEELLTSFLEGFHARTFPQQDEELASTENEADCGVKWHALCRKFDHVSFSWKTHRCLFGEDLPLYSLILPKWGMMRDGELFRRTTPEHLTNENASGLWATPTARDWKSGKASQATMERNSRPLSEQVGGNLNPQWVEWLMGWPIEWTDLKPLETDKFQQWQRSHGEF